jgi:hypothetical protein
MALTITEYTNLAVIGLSLTDQAQIAMQPPVAVQTAVVIGASSAQSAAFAVTTRFIEISADANCRIAVGSNPTATANNTLLQSGGVLYYGVRPGDKIAVIAA